MTAQVLPSGYRWACRDCRNGDGPYDLEGEARVEAARHNLLHHVDEAEVLRRAVHHHISPLIGWLRKDALNGKVDSGGERVRQFNERVELAIAEVLADRNKVVEAPEAEYTVCHAERDGDCYGKLCPQLRDGEPRKSGRHCPLDTGEED